MREAHQAFPCFGSRCGVWASGRAAEEAVADARRRLEAWHVRFSRFRAGSELARLNGDPRAELPVERDDGAAAAGRDRRRRRDRRPGRRHAPARDRVGRLPRRPCGAAPAAARAAARAAAPPGGPERTLALGARSRSPATSFAARPGSRSTAADSRRGCSPTCSPNGSRQPRASRSTAAATCASAAPRARSTWPTRSAARRCTRSSSPTPPRPRAGSAAGAGSTRDGRPAHHLLDPATGAPAFTGVVQATALAPTAVEAEWRAKAAVLSGPQAATWLTHGGVVVLDDGSHHVVPANSQPRPSRRSRFVPNLEPHPEPRRTR